MNERDELLRKYAATPIKGGVDNLLNFVTQNTGPKDRLAALKTAHEEFHGKRPNFFQEMMYNLLSLAQIEDQLKEFANLKRTKQAN